MVNIAGPRPRIPDNRYTFRCMWVAAGAPESAVTGKKYRGINNLYLSLVAMAENYGDNRWATFRQMEEKGWTFKKDEEGHTLGKGKSVSVEYYEMRDKETKRRFDRSVLDGMTFDEQREYITTNDCYKHFKYDIHKGKLTFKKQEKPAPTLFMIGCNFDVIFAATAFKWGTAYGNIEIKSEKLTLLSKDEYARYFKK